VTHDLAVVHQIAAAVVVLSRGHVVEAGPTEAVFTRPEHPHTRELLEAVPIPDPARARSKAARNRAAASTASATASA
jgi:peptide/nickel transport system ATP-binding protein